MILYFSGTGNSRAVAEYLGTKIGEKSISLTDIAPMDLTFAGDNLIFVCPVYSWGISPFILNYVKNLSEEFKKDASRVKSWLLLCCGDDTGRAPEMFEKSLLAAGLTLSGIWSVIMPNNYVLLPGFDVDSKEVERIKLEKFPERVDQIADLILSSTPRRDFHAGSIPGLKTGIVYPLFKRFGIVPSKWYANFNCIGCGKCERVCGMRNITMRNSRPEWGNNCVSCVACYHVCPKNAVQYGKITRGKGQYFYHVSK